MLLGRIHWGAPFLLFNIFVRIFVLNEKEMALTNGDLVNLVNIVLNKDLSGNSISPAEMQSLINAKSKLLFADLLGIPNEYARNVPVARKGAGINRVVSSALRPFYKKETLSVIGGVADLTGLSETYAYLLALTPATITGRGFDELEPDQAAEVLGDPVIAPTAKDPAYEFRDDTSLLIYPSTITSVSVSYYKEPDDAVLVYVTDTDTLQEEYDAGSSTELEWDDKEKINIAYRVLIDAGVNIGRNDVAALAQQIKDSNE